MPIKILLADKSITIQKVVEMLFSGKEYEVLCVSDGETALSEASRFQPDVVLADIDLPRIDGYSLSSRLRQTPALAKTPVILMMSRDDVFDEAKARQVSISDHIAKPFESQELIGKVKRSAAAAGPAPASEPAPAARPAPPKPPIPKPPAPTPPVKPAPPKPGPKPAAPTDIFDIIREAPAPADVRKAPVAAGDEEDVYEVEPVIEVEEEPMPRETERALPIGEKAVEEMRQGLGLTAKAAPVREDQDIVSFELLDTAMSGIKEFMPPTAKPPAEPREWKPPAPVAPAPPPAREIPLSESDLWTMAEATVTKMAKEMFSKMPPVSPPSLPEAELRAMAQQAVSAMAKDLVARMPPPQVPEEPLRAMVEQAVTESASRIVRELAREIVEKVAWEVIPPLAEQLITAEIERLKAET